MTNPTTNPLILDRNETEQVFRAQFENSQNKQTALQLAASELGNEIDSAFSDEFSFNYTEQPFLEFPKNLNIAPLTYEAFVNLGRSSKPEDFNPNFEKARPDAFSIIAQFESVRTKAYRDSRGILTIGWGNTFIFDPKTKTQRKVRKGDRITSLEQLQFAYNQHLEENTYPVLKKHLPLDQMTPAEIAAITSHAWNRPSDVKKLAPAIKAYCETRDNPGENKKALKEIEQIMCKSSSAHHRNRYTVEFKIFSGELVIKNNQICLADNEIDIINGSLGTFNDMEVTPSKTGAEITKEFTKRSEIYGKNLIDTLKKEVYPNIVPQKVKTAGR